jgi:hypothetical protein
MSPLLVSPSAAPTSCSIANCTPTVFHSVTHACVWWRRSMHESPESQFPTPLCSANSSASRLLMQQCAPVQSFVSPHADRCLWGYHPDSTQRCSQVSVRVPCQFATGGDLHGHYLWKGAGRSQHVGSHGSSTLHCASNTQLACCIHIHARAGYEWYCTTMITASTSFFARASNHTGRGIVKNRPINDFDDRAKKPWTTEWPFVSIRRSNGSIQSNRDIAAEWRP